MAIGKGSMARAAKVAKPVEAKEAEVKVEVKAEVKTEAKAAPAENKEVAKAAAPAEKKAAVKKAPAKKAPATAAKKAPAKKAPVKKAEAPKAAVVTPTAQVMDMISKDRVEIGDEMPVYFY